jgi:hypothetical protein
METRSSSLKTLADVYVLLHKAGFIQMEQENTKWKTFATGKKKCRVCVLQNKDGSNYCNIANRKQRAESHARSHKSKNDVATISDIMSKMELKESKMQSKQKGFH